MHERIEAGKFVKLKKLLVKDKPFTKPGNDSCMGLFTKDGLAYFAPMMDKETKITNVRKWEQAFRVYAAIYSKANTEHVSEIWQYMHTINSAVTSFQWHNIAKYDFTFRNLISEYPNRSWAKTYIQGWNFIMRDHLQCDTHQNNGQKGFNKDNICWPFNKGKCNDPGCIKEHRCTYGGKWGHGMHICRKHKKNAGGNTMDNNLIAGTTLQGMQQLD